MNVGSKKTIVAQIMFHLFPCGSDFHVSKTVWQNTIRKRNVMSKQKRVQSKCHQRTSHNTSCLSSRVIASEYFTQSEVGLLVVGRVVSIEQAYAYRRPKQTTLSSSYSNGDAPGMESSGLTGYGCETFVPARRCGWRNQTFIPPQITR